MILDLEQSQIRFKQPVKPADPDDVEDVGNPQLDDSDIKSIQDLVPDRFMRGLKASKVDLDHGRPVKPTDCKLNFVVPSDRILIREAL